MSNLKAFGHLAWKDNRLVLPLAIALIAGEFIAQSTLTLFSLFVDSQSGMFEQMAVFVGALMPGILAYAVGPMLVAGEEENGTLGWLSALPMPWFFVLSSKYLISLLWCIAITAASYIFTLVTLNSNLGNFGTKYDLSASALAYWLTYELFLWLLGFLCAYAVRSPVWALILVTPAVGLTHWLLDKQIQYLTSYYFAASSFAVVVLTGVILIVATVCLSWLRMIRPWFTAGLVSVAPQALEPYSPKSVSQSRPSEWTAFLWQQWRQYSLVGISILGIIVLPTILSYTFFRESQVLRRIGVNSGPLVVHRFDPVPWTVISALIGASILGCMTFYGDAVKSKCLFVGERGFSSFKFWVSRLVVSVAFATASLFIAITLVIQERDSNEAKLALSSIGLVLWGLGVVSPMVIKRPLLAFFLPVILLTFGGILFGHYQAQYEGVYLWTTMLSCLVAILASYHLCERWITKRLDAGYYARLSVYGLVALFIPTVCVLLIRTSTAPRVDRQWKNAMLISAQTIWAQPQTESIFAPGTTIFEPASKEKNKEVTLNTLRLELEGKDQIGSHVDYAALIKSSIPIIPNDVSPDDHETFEKRVLEAKVWLSWSRRVREAMVEGRVRPDQFFHYAESSEKGVLTRFMLNVPEHYKYELSKEFPSKELRKKSRLAAINRMWTDYYEDSHDGSELDKFAGFTLASRNPWLLVEEWRQTKIIDKATELMTEQIQSEGNFKSDESKEELLGLLDESSSDLLNFLSHNQNTSFINRNNWKRSDLSWVFWIADTESLIDQWATQAPVADSSKKD